MSENKGRLYPGRLLLSAEKRKAFSHGSHPDPYCMNDYVPYSRKEQGGQPGQPISICAQSVSKNTENYRKGSESIKIRKALKNQWLTGTIYCEKSYYDKTEKIFLRHLWGEIP